jgi:hypothetical protein
VAHTSFDFSAIWHKSRRDVGGGNSRRLGLWTARLPYRSHWRVRCRARHNQWTFGRVSHTGRAMAILVRRGNVTRSIALSRYRVPPNLDRSETRFISAMTA